MVQVLVSRFAVVGWVFCSLVSFPLLIFGQCDGCVLPVFSGLLSWCVQRMTVGVGGWDNRMSWGKQGSRSRFL